MTKTNRRSLRSTTMTALLLGGAAFALSACKEERVEAQVFPDKDACLSAAAEPGSWWTAAECDTSFAEATALHEETAPRYADKALCEEQHDGACYVQQSSGGNSVFLPLMMGYMMGNMMNNNSASSYRAQPLYKTSTGSYAAANGTRVSGREGATTLRPASFQAATSTKTAAPMTRATVQSRGGFGASRTSSGGSRSFGG